jgi:sigma-B regulation protein RsbU (phosphoserine phosphatase)
MAFVPLYDKGVALNAVVLLKEEPNGFPRDRFAEHVWMSNLFGRATHSLVLADEVRRAYNRLDRELQTVADIQRSLLPTVLPNIPTLDLATDYQTSTRAGGDYYDFFPLPEGQWGILIADVSGHGTPAAVIMAVTHSIAHMLRGPCCPPSRMMTFVNQHLTARYTGGSGTFVTAFYGIYDPATRRLSYSSAGHPSPRLIRDDKVVPLDTKAGLPLGIDETEEYYDCQHTLEPDDTFVLYTDGITEARNPEGDMFGEDRLDTAACCHCDAATTLRAILDDLEIFRAGRALADDRTLLVARVVQI